MSDTELALQFQDDMLTYLDEKNVLKNTDMQRLLNGIKNNDLSTSDENILNDLEDNCQIIIDESVYYLVQLEIYPN